MKNSVLTTITLVLLAGMQQRQKGRAEKRKERKEIKRARHIFLSFFLKKKRLINDLRNCSLHNKSGNVQNVSIHPSIYPSIHPFIHPSIHPSILYISTMFFCFVFFFMKISKNLIQLNQNRPLQDICSTLQ